MSAIKKSQVFQWNSSPIPPTKFDVCLYHSNCPDGIGGAYPFWKANKHRTSNFKDDQFILQGVSHHEPYPADLIRGKRVVIVDFCYSRMDTIKICQSAKHVVILDHHDTAQRELNDLVHPNLSYLFDMSRSGAQIAWDYCFDKPRPWFIEIIADRDLWVWVIPNSREIGKALYHGGWYTWEKMEELEKSQNPKDDRKKFLEEGKALLAIETKEIERVIRTSMMMEFLGYHVRIATCNPNIRSDVGNQLSKMENCDFAAIWRYDSASDQWWINLRGSNVCTIALNKLCENYGGGGHPRACGFAIHGVNSLEWKKASGVRRQKLAYGTLDKYFKPIT